MLLTANKNFSNLEPMTFNTSFISGKSLKEGAMFVLDAEPDMLYKLEKVYASKPGKHGSAKHVIEAKELLTGKKLSTTFGADAGGVRVVEGIDYVHKIVYGLQPGAVIVDLAETDESVLKADDFIYGRKKLKSVIETKLSSVAHVNTYDQNFVDADGSPLCIKFTECMEGDQKKFVFWDMFYCPVSKLDSIGIYDYMPYN